MKSIQTRITLMISTIMIAVVVLFLVTSTIRTNAILDNDSEQILVSAAEYYANIIDDNFRSTEQSVHTIYNYALKRTETYTDFLINEEQRDRYTYDISELGKSIAENTRGAMAVYLRYNPEDYGSSNGLWYTINLEDGSWQPSVPTDMALYDKDDLEHVGWYYVPIAAGEPVWMDPYYNANLGVNMISYIIPYYYKGYTVGIIGMDISMDLLKEAVSGVSVYESGRAFLMARNGDLIYHDRYPLGVELKYLPQKDRDYFKNILESEKDKVHVVLGRDDTQRKLIIKELKNGMLLGVYAPLSEISAPQGSLLRQQLGISIIILCLGLFACLTTVSTITNPLKRMTAVAEQYANGNFNEEISVNGEDEVGILSRSLQTMSTSLKQQIELANSANKLKSDFLANMSHEIRTPINAVLGMNEMILRETTEDNIRDYSADINTAGKTLLSLINSILDFSKIEDGKMEIMPVSYDTASLVNNLVKSISERARAKGLTLNTRIDENLPIVLKGDDVRITQIIMNLLTNAVKYTEKGEITLSVWEDERTDDKLVLGVEVKDTGIGIRKEDIDKLAMSFTRIEEKRNRNIEGTGLGMAIVTRLLDMMGSKLSVESTYGEGSSFSFRLTQQIVDSHPIGNYEKRVRKIQHSEKAGEYPQIHDAKILVVDDYEMNLKVVKSLLKIFGITPDLASSGREAIEKVRKTSYNMIFLDHMMPQMDGIETLKELQKEHLLGEDTAVVALTANAVVGSKEFYLNEGFDDYLSKPIEVEALGEMLFRHLPVSLFTVVTGAKGQKTTQQSTVSESESVVMEFTPKPKDTSKKEIDAGFIYSLGTMGISVEDGLKYSADDISLYHELIVEYIGSMPEREESLIKDYKASDWDDYRIIIHSIKSASRTVGAKELSEKAKALEDAAKNGDTRFIHSNHDAVLKMIHETTDNMTKALGDID